VANIPTRIAHLEGKVQGIERLLERSENGRRIAQARVRLLEEILVDVWRWTNDGHPHVELLTPMLERADTEYALLRELDALEKAHR
jgi:hypothetical protein